MRRRALAAALSLFALAAAAAAAPDPKKSDPKQGTKPAQKRKTLPQLKRERDVGYKAYFEGQLDLQNLQLERSKLERELARANAELKAAQKMRASPLRTSEIQKAKRKLHRIGQKLATNKFELEPQAHTQSVRRLVLIYALSDYASRLLEVAYRMSYIRPRKKQAQEHISRALSDLKLRSKLRQQNPPVPQPPKRIRIGNLTRSSDLVKLIKRLGELVRVLDKQLKYLRPLEDQQERHVRHLARLEQVPYYVPNLGKRLKAERDALQRIKDLKKKSGILKRTYLHQQDTAQRILRKRAQQQLEREKRARDRERGKGK